MIELCTLGALELRQRDGPEFLSVLSQPRRIALLCFLAVALPRGFHRRDKLLTLFWPEHDAERARAALRQAVYFLRRSLGDATLVGRGDEDLGVAQAELWCDVVAFEEAIAQGRMEEALTLYRGDLLTGFHVGDAPGFEEWLEQERARLRGLAAQAAAAWTHEAHAAGTMEHALTAARRAMELEPYDEPALRRLLKLLHEAGDRAGALRAYEEFRERFVSGLELELSPETVQLVGALRLPAADAGTRSDPGEGVGRRADPSVDAGAHIASVSRIDVASDASPRRRPSRRNVAVIGVGVAALVVIAFFLFAKTSDVLARDGVVVAALENETADSALEPVGRVAADWITHGLQRIDLVRVVPTPTALQAWRFVRQEIAAGRVRDPVQALAMETGARTVVWVSVYPSGDSLRFQAQVTDAARGRLLRSVEAFAESRERPLEGVEQLRQRVMAAVALEMDAGSAGPDFNTMRPPTYDAYQEMLEGTERAILLEWRAALPHLRRAAALDTSYAAPLVLAALAHMNLSELAQADSLIRLAGKSPVQLSRAERLLLDAHAAWIRREWSVAMRTFAQLSRLSPEPMWAFSVARMGQALNRPRETVEWLGRLDPDRGTMRGFTPYWQVLVNAHHMRGDHRAELRAARRARERFPDLRRVLDLIEVPALIARGQPDEAVRLLEQERPSLPAKGPGLSQLAATYWTALELRAHGHSERALGVLDRAITHYRGLPAGEPPTIGTMFEYAELLYLAERWEEAYTLFAKLATERPDQLALQGYLAVTGARFGLRAEAERISLQLAARDTPYLFGAHTFWRARIAAVLGEKRAAVRLLHDALRQGMGHGLWSHRELDLESLRDDPEFKQLIRPQS